MSENLSYYGSPNEHNRPGDPYQSPLYSGRRAVPDKSQNLQQESLDVSSGYVNEEWDGSDSARLVMENLHLLRLGESIAADDFFQRVKAAEITEITGEAPVQAEPASTQQPELYQKTQTQPSLAAELPKRAGRAVVRGYKNVRQKIDEIPLPMHPQDKKDFEEHINWRKEKVNLHKKKAKHKTPRQQAKHGGKILFGGVVTTTILGLGPVSNVIDQGINLVLNNVTPTEAHIVGLGVGVPITLWGVNHIRRGFMNSWHASRLEREESVFAADTEKLQQMPQEMPEAKRKFKRRTGHYRHRHNRGKK